MLSCGCVPRHKPNKPIQTVTRILRNQASGQTALLRRVRTRDDAHSAARAAVLQHVEHLESCVLPQQPHLHAIFPGEITQTSDLHGQDINLSIALNIVQLG